MRLQELFIIVSLLTFAVFFASGIIDSRIKDRKLQKLFKQAFYFKLLCAITYAILYMTHFGNGDALNYFNSGTLFLETLKWEPQYFFELFSLYNYRDSTQLLEKNQILGVYSFIRLVPANMMVTLVSGVTSLFTLNSFIGTSIIFSCFSFTGVSLFAQILWKKYRSIKMVAWMLFLPSLTFWSASVSKEALVLLSLGVIVYMVYQVVEVKQWRQRYLVLFPLALFILFVVKTYVLMVLVLAFTLYLLKRMYDGYKDSRSVFVLLSPLLLIVVFGMIGLLFQYIGASNDRYAISSAVENIAHVQTYHANQSSVEGGYALGFEGELTVGKLFSKMPLSLFYALFKPFVWEVRSPLMIIYAIENLVLLLIAIGLLIKLKWVVIYKALFRQDSFIFMCMTFIIIFGILVGITSYNYGALSRYRIPLIPFLLIAWTAIHTTNKGLKSR